MSTEKEDEKENATKQFEQNSKQNNENDDEVGKPKTAFFITQLGSDDSAIRRHTNGIIRAVIRPVLDKHKILLTTPHEIDDSGNITKQVITQILTVNIVIADLTGLNPNVMYELAVRHARRLPVIVICEYGTKLPFDIAAERTFFYTNDMYGTTHLYDQLDKSIPKALLDEKPDNPIYNGMEISIIQSMIKESDDPVKEFIVEKLSRVDELYNMMRSFLAQKEEPRLNDIWQQLFDQKKEVSQSVISSDYWSDSSNYKIADENNVVIGDIVHHNRNGEGVILDLINDSDGVKAVVEYKRSGIKTTTLKHASHKVAKKN